MSWTSAAQILISFFGTLASSGPWGILAMLLGAGGVVGAISYLIGKFNKSVDARDLEKAGADAGNSAVELKNQADANRDFENRSRDEILKGN